MAITINGDGTLTGISTGGLPDGIVDTDMLATDAVTAAKIGSLPAGSILQVKSTTKTDTYSSSGSSYADITGLSVSITPTSSSNKVLVMVTMTMGNQGSGQSVDAGFRLVRGSTAIAVGDAAGSRTQVSFGVNGREANEVQNGAMTVLDSPATTSATTYKVQGIATSGTVFSVNSEYAGISGNAAAYMRSASTITVMEVAA